MHNFIAILLNCLTYEFSENPYLLERDAFPWRARWPLLGRLRCGTLVAGVSWFLVRSLLEQVWFVPPWPFCRFLVGWSKLECPVHALGPLGKVRHSGGGTSISVCSLSQTSLSFAFTVCVCCHLNRWLVLQCEPLDSSAHSRLIFEVGAVDAVSDLCWVLLLAHASVNSLLRAQRLRGG